MHTLLVAGSTLLVLLIVIYRLWRVLDGDQEIEPGGSYSRQLFGRYRKPKLPESKAPTPRRNRRNAGH
jgi:hypothetical protein